MSEYVSLRQWRKGDGAPKKDTVVDAGFRPTIEMEGVRLAKKEAMEATHRQWYASRMRHRAEGIRRLGAKHVADLKADSHTWDEYLRHQQAVSNIDCQRKLNAVEFDKDFLSRRKEFSNTWSTFSQNAHNLHMECRQKYDEHNLFFESRRGDILSQAAAKGREVHLEHVAAEASLLKECRQQRRMQPGSSHIARLGYFKYGAEGHPPVYAAQKTHSFDSQCKATH